jgi:hypothetical protein
LAPVIPEILLASPGIEFEVRGNSSQPAAMLLPQGASQDLALMSFGPHAPSENSTVTGDGKDPLDKSADDEEWDQLITDLAAGWER